LRLLCPQRSSSEGRRCHNSERKDDLANHFNAPLARIIDSKKNPGWLLPKAQEKEKYHPGLSRSFGHGLSRATQNEARLGPQNYRRRWLPDLKR
jgi:hypothetical protein